MRPKSSDKRTAWLQKLYEEGHIKKAPSEPAQEQPPELFPDLYWIWESYCFLSERRGVGPGGPLPITVSDMNAFIELTGRIEPRYRRQLVRFIPPLDRAFLKDFYDRQKVEMDKNMRKAESSKRKR